MLEADEADIPLEILTAQARTAVADNIGNHDERPTSLKVSLPVGEETVLAIDILQSLFNNMMELHAIAEPGQSVMDYTTSQPPEIQQDIIVNTPEKENKHIHKNIDDSKTKMQNMEQRKEEEGETTKGKKEVDEIAEKRQERGERVASTIEMDMETNSGKMTLLNKVNETEY